jgi:hypothetical protein
MDQPTADGLLQQLEPLVGDWRVVATPPGGEPLPDEGRASFEWHDSRTFLIQRTTINVAGAPDSVAIIGCDGANGTYYQLYSDDRGVCRVYEMSIAGGVWKLWREGEPFPQRFSGRIADDGNRIDGRWERADDGVNYAADFDLTYLRIQ